jgi:membrane fusion protein, adhesin transport system
MSSTEPTNAANSSETSPARRAVETLPAMKLVRPPSAPRTLAAVLTSLVALVAVTLSVTPWQQTATGSGRVVAYAPLDRQQTIEAPIEGRITHWHVREGSHVEEGDRLADITDNDPLILDRLRAERDAVQARLDAARTRVGSVTDRAASLVTSRESGMVAAAARAQMARDRVRAAEQALLAATAARDTSSLNLERQRSLLDQGLTSTRTRELAELEATRTITEVQRAEATLSAAKSEASAVLADRGKVGTDLAAVLADVEASRSSALAEVANATGELARIEVRLSRQRAQAITAPRTGTVLRLLAAQGTEMVKAGDAIAVFVPDTADRAVELWVDGNDVPLVTDDRHVRLQFEGWPALQFSGWPSVAVGTFGGKVAFVDAADDGKGKFRVVVVPDGTEPWPTSRYLRQGVRANGWVLLGRVKLGYELWRQFNGFPPVVTAPDQAKTETGKKDSK